MAGWPPDMLLIVAAVSTGLAVALALTALADRRVWVGIGSTPDRPATDRRLAVRREAAAQSPWFATVLPAIVVLGTWLEQPRFHWLREYVADPYHRAGRSGGLSDGEAAAAGVLAGGVGAALLAVLLGVLLGPVGLLLGSAGVPAGLLATVSGWKTRGDLRARQIEALLPYAVDLIVLVLRSGTSFNLALRQVVQDYADHPLGEEFGQVLQQIDLGADRSDALKKLAEYLDIEQMHIFVDNVLQSEELGWPLADTLERLSDRMSSQRILRAQSAAGKASVMIMMPSALILLAVMLILFGPIIVRFLLGEYGF